MNAYDPAAVKRYYSTAALVSGAIGGALVMYAAVAEILRLAAGYQPPLAGSASAAALRPALYVLAFASIAAARIIPSRIATARKPADPAGLAALLTRVSISRTALYEVPGVLGLAGWLAAGFYPDLYALLGLSLALVIKNFPRLPDWEREFAARFGAVAAQETK
ncbi:MAG: hypothetical protein RDU13_06240 [Elusimicrobiales bacterium]|jgi:hypothetical protein|nr:hypothetical protein [Elusimicrobiales bacterium]